MKLIERIAKWHLARHGYHFRDMTVVNPSSPAVPFNYCDRKGFTVKEFSAQDKLPLSRGFDAADHAFMVQALKINVVKSLMDFVEVTTVADPRGFDKVYRARIHIAVRNA
jgi:hypothetical protein